MALNNPRDFALVTAVVAYFFWHALLLASGPSTPLLTGGSAIVVAAATVWISNTVAHVHLHTPLFIDRRHNHLFSRVLSALTLIPQSVWKSRHLQHHAGRRSTFPRWSIDVTIDLLLVTTVVTAYLVLEPHLAVTVLLPGLAVGLGLAALQGQMEHVHDAAGGVSCYSALYNACWFNDGYHAEHHARPRTHWSLLPKVEVSAPQTSRQPPLLRWTEDAAGELLGLLEKIAMRFPWVERWLVLRHQRAFGTLLTEVRPSSILIVGGGLFPRTLLALRALFPDASFRVVDRSRASLDCASRSLRARGAPIPTTLHASFEPQQAADVDLVVFPLAFGGRRAMVHETLRHARMVVVHDWIWAPARDTVPISRLLVKRMNLFRR